MDLKNLNNILENQPKYRYQQINKAIFSDFVENWDQSTTLPKDLIVKLKEDCSINIKSEIVKSKDRNTIKAVIELHDNNKIETVLLKHKDKRNTVCVSSQIGCCLNCDFCATGQMGFTRNLTTWEIIEQVLLFARYLKKKNEQVTNIVFMGMGEPFLNYENVIKSIHIMNEKAGLNIGARKISISTVGILEGIQKLAKEPLQLNLAISLHAPNNKIRDKLIPVNKKYPIEKILNATNKYIEKTNRKVMIEYVLINGLNDQPEHAKELSQLLDNPLFIVNLLILNKVGKYIPSTTNQAELFRSILIRNKINAIQRFRFGTDVKAACGQLITKND